MKFIVYAPNFNHASGGTLVIYDLCNQLKRLGHQADIIIFGTYREFDPESIVIYPEIIHNNPLNAQRVVRYFLHLDSYISGKPIQRGPNDFIITWTKKYYQDSHAVLFKYLIHEYFNDKNTRPPLERNLDCTWIHKGINHTETKVIPNSIHIGGNGPLSKRGMADLLRQTRVLYSYDSLTSVINEAIVCGAFVVPLFWYPFKPEEIVGTELEFPWISTSQDGKLIIPIDYNEQRERFINKIQTVNKNYSNTLESIIEQMRIHFNC